MAPAAESGGLWGPDGRVVAPREKDGGMTSKCIDPDLVVGMGAVLPNWTCPICGRELPPWELHLTLGDFQCCMPCAGEALKWVFEKMGRPKESVGEAARRNNEIGAGRYFGRAEIT